MLPFTDVITVPQKLQAFLDEARAPLPQVADLDEPLHIDSLAFIRLVAFLETDLGFRVEDDDLFEENFRTLRAICELMDSAEQPNSRNFDRQDTAGSVDFYADARVLIQSDTAF